MYQDPAQGSPPRKEQDGPVTTGMSIAGRGASGTAFMRRATPIRPVKALRALPRISAAAMVLPVCRAAAIARLAGAEAAGQIQR
jgi:hypothetical protein